MISVSDLSIKYTAGLLFDRVSLQFNSPNRYGLVGANGSGKTTFLKILAGDETGFEGKVHIPKELTMGVLSQDHYRFENERIVDVVIGGDEVLFDSMRKKERLLAESSGEHGEVIAKLEETIVSHEGYSAEARACRLLSGLGVDSKMHFEPLNKLSGGYKLRTLLARVLFQNPDILLLDEPTNHLDILSIAWLEEYLTRQFRGLLLLISHDRHFLNRICNYIADVDFQTITLYKGNYDKYTQARSLALEQKLKEIKSLEKKTEQLQQFVDRFKAKASKARQAQSRAKQIEKIELPEIIRSTRQYPGFAFQQTRPAGRDVLSAKMVSKSYGDSEIFSNVNFTIHRGEKIAVIGPNGAGKTTLLKIIMGIIDPSQGKIKWGYETHPSYFAQDHKETLLKDKTKKMSIYDWMYQNCPDPTPTKVRALLARVLFTQDDIKKLIENLSGGETARLVLGRIMEERPNVLLLDEPTNHLDLESIEALEDALTQFEGTCIFVSHDKSFVSNVADKIFEVTPAGLVMHDGSYEDYLEKLGSDYLERAMVKEVASKSPVKAVSDHQTLYRDKKEKKRRLQKLSSQSEKLEKEIEKNENLLKEIELKFADSDFYEKAGPEGVRLLESRKKSAEEELAAAMKSWEETHGEMEELAVGE